MSTATVLLFNTCAAPQLAARLHTAECAMVNTAKSRPRGKVKLITGDIEETVADLNERGFPVKECKCLKLR